MKTKPIAQSFKQSNILFSTRRITTAVLTTSVFAPLYPYGSTNTVCVRLAVGLRQHQNSLRSTRRRPTAVAKQSALDPP